MAQQTFAWNPSWFGGAGLHSSSSQRERRRTILYNFSMAPLPAVSPAVALTTVQPFLVDVDLVFLPMFEGDDPTSVVRGLDDTATAALSRAFSTHEIQGRPFELFLSSAAGGRGGRRGRVGCGRASDASTELLRKAATFAALSARQRRVGRIAFVDRAT